ncbi:MAG: glycosyltransferase family 4 protein [Leptospiraceae bacterium]|nr:glycosyltransferase family 4 protein [Leptospiraceae bacterium]
MSIIHKALILVDARPLAWPGTGNASYLFGMLRELVRSQPDTHWLLAAHRGIHQEFAELLLQPNVEVRIDSSGLNRLGPFWLHWTLPRLINRLQPNLLWASLAALPWRYQKRCPAVPALTNFHDLNAYVAPRTMQRWNRWQHRFLDHQALVHSDAVVCLSKTTRSDIQRVFPDITPSKMHVVYPGCEIHGSESRAPRSIAHLKHFFLCVGTIEPRKNQITVLTAWLSAKAAQNELIPLVFVGRRGWGETSVYDRLHSGALQAEGVYFIEGASQAELSWCYSKCSMVILPSLHEGFGLPVIEAYSYGKPCILSDIPIFREVGSKSSFVSPLDANAWQATLTAKSRQIQSGKNRQPAFNSKTWSWKKKAAELGGILASVARPADKDLD